MEEQIGALLQSAPHIVERILRQLSARDIIRVAGVCRLWQKYATIVLKERRRIVTIMAEVMQEYSKKQPTVEDSFEMKEFLQDLDIECGLAIIFYAFDMNLYAFELHNVCFKAFRSCLPRSSTIIGAVGYSEVVDMVNNRLCHKKENPLIDCLSAFLLPKTLPEGTHVTHFSLKLARATQLVNTELTKAVLEEAFEWPKDEVAKCIILVATESMEEMNHNLVATIETAYDQQVALAGSTAHKLYFSSYLADDDVDDEEGSDYLKLRFRDRPKYVGLVFGGENVRAASLVIRPEEGTKEGIEKRLKELKAVVDGWGECKQKIGFMFACMYDVEARIFRQLMPDTPLNGMFSTDTFGWDYPPPAASEPAGKRSAGAKLDLYGCTTIAVVGFV